MSWIDDFASSFADESDDDDDPSPEYEAARRYHEAGFNVIPLVHKTKKAMVLYADLHHRRQTRAEVAMMRPLFDGGVAVITGAVSGVVCIDCDGPEGEAVLQNWEAAHGPMPKTWTIRSGSGRGLHRYYKHPGFRVKTKANPSVKLDIKGDGGIAVVPPSLHNSGGRYEVVCGAPIANLPDGLLDFIEERVAKVKGQSTKVSVAKTNSHGGDKTLGDNLSRRVPTNRRNIAIVQSMLDVLPDQCVVDYDTWFRIGAALHSFNSGLIGLALWRKFSMRDKSLAAKTDFERVWSSFDRAYEGRRISLGTLWALAKEHGWQRPMAWDIREPTQPH